MTTFNSKQGRVQKQQVPKMRYLANLKTIWTKWKVNKIVKRS